ncbi:MAG: crosslink repair DNA glycosylase YcaQ family protein, partial [Acidaminobacteraceae bacterium]
MNLSKKKARRLILLHHNLLATKSLKNKDDIMNYIKKVGCIQFDPLNIIAMNPHLVLQSKVKSYKAEMLDELLYKDHRLMDGWDKNMAIFPVEDRPYFRRYYYTAIETHNWKSHDLLSYMPIARAMLDNGPITSKDLKMQDKIDWSLGPSSMARAILELMFFTGEIMVNDKFVSHKSYGYTKNYLSDQLISADDPNITDEDYFKWGVLRRIRATGILWNKASESFLGVKDLKSASRNKAFLDLYEDGITEKISIEGIKFDFYIEKSNIDLIDYLDKNYRKRVSFIAPLD